MRSGALTGYKYRVLQGCKDLLSPLSPIESGIDIGCGEGWYAQRFVADDVLKTCVGAEVALRKRREVSTVVYDGHSLPFLDRSFDLAYAIDVAHHASEPHAFLTEACRVARRWFLIKDHTYSTALQHRVLYGMDLLGNSMFKVPSPARYQRGWEWFQVVERAGFSLLKLSCNLHCHSSWLGELTNHLQFVALFERRREGR